MRPDERGTRQAVGDPADETGKPETAVTNALHVAPLRDLVAHDTSTAEPDCVCGPEVRPVTQDDGSMGWLLVHHSLDGREQADG